MGELTGEMKLQLSLCLKAFRVTDGRDEDFFDNSSNLSVNRQAQLKSYD